MNQTPNNAVPPAEPSPRPEDAAPRKKGIKQTVRYVLLLNLGVLLLSFGVYMFEVPNHFAVGGVGGISVLLSNYITPHVSWLNQPVIMAIINGVLLLIGLVLLGKGLTVRTIYCSVAYSFEVWLMGVIHPMNSPLTDKPLLELVFATLLTGSGGALIFNCDASSGGTDIIGLIFKKYTGLNIGTAMLFADFVIACLAFVVYKDDPGINNIEVGLFSVLGVFARSFIIDGVIDNLGKTKYVTIITDRPQIVSRVIIEQIDRGFTEYPAKGGYTGEEKTVIITVCGRAQATRLKAKLKEEDPSSFVIITDANEILGKGFSERR